MKLNKKIVIFFSVLFPVFGLLTSIYSQNITKGPYLLNPANTSVSIRWESDKIANGKVHFGPGNHFGQSAKAKLVGQKCSHFLYEAKLQNLRPGIRYGYQVEAGGTKSSVSHFATWWKNQKNLNFVAMGDSRSNPDIFGNIVNKVNRIDPSLGISMGDLVENGGNCKQWDDFYFNVASSVINHIPFVSTLGDHEGEGDNGDLFNFYLLGNQNVNQLWFSFDYGPAHFVSLDYRHPDDEEMIDWFKRDMEASHAKWKFVLMHRPCYNLGGHRSAWGQNIWPALFRKYRVDIVFAGHSHQYERFYPVRPSDEPDGWPVTYITTGGAGAELYEVTQNTYLAKAKSINHFVYVELAGDSLHFSAYLNNGDLLDQFKIVKQNGIYDNEYLSLVKPQEDLDMICMFARAISFSVSELPMIPFPAKVTIKLTSYLDKKLDFQISLTSKSKKDYKMKPVSGVLKPHAKLKIPLNIYSTGDMQISGWGDIDPELRLEAAYKTHRGAEKIVGKAIDYWPKKEY